MKTIKQTKPGQSLPRGGGVHVRFQFEKILREFSCGTESEALENRRATDRFLAVSNELGTTAAGASIVISKSAGRSSRLAYISELRYLVTYLLQSSINV